MKKNSILILILVLLSLACSSSDDNSNQNQNNNQPPRSDLQLLKTVNVGNPIIGNDIIFTLTVSNAGPNAATGVSVKDLLPSGYTYINNSASTSNSYDEISGVWTVPTIENGSSKTLTITASVNPSGEYNNIAEIIASDNEDPDSVPNNGVTSEDDQDNALTSPVAPSTVEIGTYYSPLSAGDGMVLDSSGNLYATNFELDIVYKIDTNQSLSTFASNQNGAAGMVFGSDNFMYLARYYDSDIVKILPDGSSINIFASGIANPIGLDFDSIGNLFVNNNFNNAITKIDVAGNATIISVNALNNSSLTIDDNDNIYVSDYTNGVITKIDPITNQSSIFTTLPVTGVGFIVYSDGYFYATGISDHVVLMIDQDGNSETIAGSFGVPGNVDGNGDIARLDSPNAITVSEDGMTLYVANDGAIRVITGFRE